MRHVSGFDFEQRMSLSAEREDGDEDEDDGYPRVSLWTKFRKGLNYFLTNEFHTSTHILHCITTSDTQSLQI